MIWGNPDNLYWDAQITPSPVTGLPAFEVAMNGMKNAAEVVEKITDLHAKTKALESEDSDKSSAHNVQNNMFVGSTAELMAMLKDTKN